MRAGSHSKALPRVVALALLLFAILACGPQTTAGGSSGQAAQGATDSQASRTVAIIGRTEPSQLASPGLRSSGTTVDATQRPFNAHLDIDDAREQTLPYLAEALPKLNTDTWRVFPDGRMETRYTLRPNITWHDSTPLAAEDFVFAWKVQTRPELGASAGGLRADMEEVSAPDSRTILIRWKRLRPEAARLDTTGSSLPRHILEEPLQTLAPDAFIAHPYWSFDFVGLGPYKLERWEPGAFLEGVAFDGHVWGKPRIGKIVVRWTTDENTALANMLSEAVHMVTDLAIRFEQGQVLKRDWASNGRGVVLSSFTMNRRTYFQLRPELATPRFLTDLRVRRAFAHSVDRDALNDGLFEGQGMMSDSLVRPSAPFFADVDRAMAKYAYDPRRTEQLLTEAGFSRGSDGVFVDPAGARFSLQIQNQPGAQPERESAIMMETWRRAGIEAQLHIQLSTATATRHTFPSLHSAGGGIFDVSSLATWDIGAPENRYSGNNRAGWSNAEYDAIVERWDTALDSAARAALAPQLVRLYTQEVPVIGLFFHPVVAAHVSSLHGPDPGTTDTPNLVWNIHEWIFT